MKHKPADPNIAALLYQFENQGWFWDGEIGKFRSGDTKVISDLPWITQNLDFDCFGWNRLFHHGVAGGKMVHTHCQTCFKVVVAPRTFMELLRLEEYQEQCGLRCKCGIETREYVSRTYGGYFYSWEPGDLELMVYDEGEPEEGKEVPAFRVINDSGALRKGQLKYERIVKDMAEHVQIGDIPIPVILKRGCTEFEMHLGPTNLPQYRHISDEQIALERALDDNVEFTNQQFVSKQPDAVKDAIRMRWAEWAHYIGDMTYVEWLGHALSVPPVTYHEE